jgi:signal transduction histidine kinase
MMRLASWIIFWFLALLTAGSLSIAAPLPRSILVLSESAMEGPFYRGIYDALKSRAAANSQQPISFFLERLDSDRFSGDYYDNVSKTYLRSKYAGKPIGLIVTFGIAALDFALRMREETWSVVPIVFTMVNQGDLQRLNIPPNVAGITTTMRFRDLLKVARAVVPDLEQIAIVGDRWATQTDYRYFREEIPVAATGLKLVDLVGLPMRELRKRVAVLPERTAIVYTAILSDGEGTVYPPAVALGAFAKVANRPIVIPAETYLGRGGIGGYVLMPAAVGEGVADLALRVLNGESASAIPLSEGDVVRPIFDWRQLQRWGVSESQLPEGSEVRFRERTLWQQYHQQILAVCAAIVLQTIMICWLVYEHWRRRLAEVRSRNTIAELAHMNRMATAGELSASIAHEVNQPLSGITLRANAALRWLTAETPDIDKVRVALTQIMEAGHRAADVVTSIRAMFRKDTTERTSIDINDLILTVLTIIRADLQRRGVELQTELDGKLPLIMGDKVQLQQVLLNLVLNAIDAMQQVQLRVLTVRSEKSKPNTLHVSINDTGTGVDPSNIDRIFKPLFTTKASGMGMGLSICRSIIESHGGRIWVSPGANGGSSFEFELPTKSAEREVDVMAA